MKLSSRNLISLLLTVSVSGQDLPSVEKAQDFLHQITINSNINDRALAFSSTIRDTKQTKDYSPLQKLGDCSDTTSALELVDPHFGMENLDGNVMMNTCKISKGNKKSIINCNVKKFGNKYNMKTKLKLYEVVCVLCSLLQLLLPKKPAFFIND